MTQVPFAAMRENEGSRRPKMLISRNIICGIIKMAQKGAPLLDILYAMKMPSSALQVFYCANTMASSSRYDVSL